MSLTQPLSEREREQTIGNYKSPTPVYPIQLYDLHDIAGAIDELSKLPFEAEPPVFSLKILANHFSNLLEQIDGQQGTE